MDLNLTWSYVADTVMGGVSQGALQADRDGTGAFVRLTGDVSLDNNGGFIQMAADLRPDRSLLDASGFTGIAIRLRGNGERYDVRLRTDALTRPWQSFRAEVVAPVDWVTINIPFTDFRPHRTSAVFDPSRLRRIGILAIGREMRADISVAAVSLYI